ncbi:dihydrolipoamide acetyltransferase family protein [Halalkalibacterium ligniniphilum]|uniref:dihydrolipoamide acetyltransferase family protein n=1 Tax=Halalkalibacterium ligniniphilum TaxID=1134413 RepID=UPI00034922BA|nr:dihydrolipoamide acetyltransferase family protein [Halalkalibacterium ligniniphilum]
MVYEFKLPDVGEGIAEGEIVKWFIKPGDVIKEDQIIVEVQNDKAVVEISSPVAGEVAALHYEEGDTAEVGSVIVSIKTSDLGKAASEKAKPQKTAKVAEAEKTQSVTDTSALTQVQGGSKRKYLPLAVPSVRRIARELNVDLTLIKKGTGKGDRITEEDVRAFLKGTYQAEKAESNAGTERNPSPVVANDETDERVPLKGIRKQIAQNMMKSLSSSAQSTVMDEVNVTALVSLRKKINEDGRDKGVKLTYLPFIIKATVRALQEFPYLNAALDMDAQEIVLKKAYNIGIAVDTTAGLMVPVVKRANAKNLLQLSEEMSELSEKARASKLQMGEMQGGTFTISNIGSTRAVQFGTPILNHPEVAILGINKIQKKPIVANDEITIGYVMSIGLTFDHQVIDGVMAANFLKRIMELLEKPHLLFLEL